MNPLEGFLARRETVLGGGLIALYLAVYTTLAILRHRTFHSFGFDLALFDQVFWNTVNGRPFESSISLADPRLHSYLGDHFSPVYGLLAPIYAAYPHPETLIVIQSLFVALGALPVYLLAREKLAPGLPRLAWVAVYFLFLPVAYITLVDFHDVALSVLPLGLALYFLETRRRLLFLACIAFTFLIKEEMPLIGIAFGAYAALGKRQWAAGLGLMAASLLAFYLVVGVAIPHFRGGSPYIYFADRYGALGSSLGQILTTVLTNPVRLAHVLFQPKKAEFVLGLFGPVLFLTLLSRWAALLVVPTLGYLLLSGYEPMYSFATQYSAPLIALILGTSILALARFGPTAQKWLALAVLASSLAFAFVFGDLPFSRHFDPATFRADARYAAFLPSLRQVPAEASVASQDGVTSHIAERRRLYSINYEGVAGADYVVLDVASDGHDIRAHLARVASLEAEGYVELAEGPGLALLRKKR